MNILNMEGLIKGDLGSCKKVTKEVVPTKVAGNTVFMLKILVVTVTNVLPLCAHDVYLLLICLEMPGSTYY